MDEFLYLLKTQKWNMLFFFKKTYILQIALLVLFFVRLSEVVAVLMENIWSDDDGDMYMSQPGVQAVACFISYMFNIGLAFLICIQYNWVTDIADSTEIWKDFKATPEDIPEMETELLQEKV
jgi:hypothetical protein